MSRQCIAWNRLTILEVTAILQHWQNRRAYYLSHAAGQSTSIFDDDLDDRERAYASSQLPVIDSRIHLWQQCVAAATKHQPITPFLNEYRRS